MRCFFVACLVLGFVSLNEARAESCAALPDCHTLGYVQGKTAACGENDANYIKCPSDPSYLKCVNYDCAGLGFSTSDKSGWCAEDAIVKCPKDENYTLCAEKREGSACATHDWDSYCEDDAFACAKDENGCYTEISCNETKGWYESAESCGQTGLKGWRLTDKTSADEASLTCGKCSALTCDWSDNDYYCTSEESDRYIAKDNTSCPAGYILSSRGVKRVDCSDGEYYDEEMYSGDDRCYYCEPENGGCDCPNYCVDPNTAVQECYANGNTSCDSLYSQYEREYQGCMETYNSCMAHCQNNNYYDDDDDDGDGDDDIDYCLDDCDSARDDCLDRCNDYDSDERADCRDYCNNDDYYECRQGCSH